MRGNYCMFCGSTTGQFSDRNAQLVNAVYYCSKCDNVYYDQCSYEKNGNQLCLRCDTKLDDA